MKPCSASANFGYVDKRNTWALREKEVFESDNSVPNPSIFTRDGSYACVKVKTPASVANLGPGFDVLGLALDVMFDTVKLKLTKERGVAIEVSGVEADLIPTDPLKNTAGIVALEFLKLSRENNGVEIRIKKGILTGVGLGSSGASASATAFGLNALLGLNLTKNRLVELAAKGEIASAGAAHADNVAPSLLGGLTIIRSYEPLDVISLPPPNVTFILAVPLNIKKRTEKARSILPKSVELHKMIQNLGSTSSIVAGFLLPNINLIGKGMLGDAVVEPIRAPLYPGHYRVYKAALSAGAEGVAISGAGPTIISVINPEKVKFNDVASSMKEAFEWEGVQCKTYIAKPTHGADFCDSSLEMGKNECVNQG